MQIISDEMPLRWPEDRPRTAPHRRAAYVHPWGPGSIRRDYLEALATMGAARATLSLGGRGDPGVACYFTIYGRNCVVTCDAMSTTDGNIVGATGVILGLAAVRDHQGDDAFRRVLNTILAKETLPSWCRFYGFDEIPERSALEKAHKRRLFEAHPDRGGTSERMVELLDHLEDARSYYSKHA